MDNKQEEQAQNLDLFQMGIDKDKVVNNQTLSELLMLQRQMQAAEVFDVNSRIWLKRLMEVSRGQ